MLVFRVLSVRFLVFIFVFYCLSNVKLLNIFYIENKFDYGLIVFKEGNFGMVCGVDLCCG